MPRGSGQRPLLAVVVGLAVAAACGRTSQDSRPAINPTDNAAGASAAQGGNAQAVAGSPSGAAAGDGGDRQTASGGATEPGILLFDEPTVRVDVVGDRDGNALVKWDASSGQVQCARWVATRREWLYPAPVTIGEAFLVDTQRSGHPILIGDETDPDTGATTTVVRRFNVERNEWGPSQAIGIDHAFAYGFHLSMDGAGNVYAYWPNEGGASLSWTWWPVDHEEWEPPQPIEHASRIVGARERGAWLWQESSGFAVRAFDIEAGAWGDEHELQPLGQEAAFSVHQFAVGPSGEALATSWRETPTEHLMEVWRYDPKLAAWQPPEIAEKLPILEGDARVPGPSTPITNLTHHDIVAVPRPDGDRYTLLMNRRDPATGNWSPLHEFAGLRVAGAIDFAADDAGNLYGSAPATGLFHYNAASGAWRDTPTSDGAFEFAASSRGAFALGWNSDRELVAYRHVGAGAAWESARGLPSGAVPELGSVAFALAALGEDAAIAVWPTRQSGRVGSVRAAFLE